MKKYCLLFVLVMVYMMLGCNNIKTEDNSWLKNGTLHKATVEEWKNASQENKLATCADFVVALKENDNEKFKTLSEIKISATEMMACIDEVTNGNTVSDNSNINEIAVLCHINLKSFYN